MPEGRWDGIARPYSPEDVERLRGSLRIRHTLAERGARRLWESLRSEPYLNALGALTGNQAVQMARAGLKAIYLSGWQVAADANEAGQTYPDQSLYPADSVPAVVRRINRALQRADQIEHSEGKTTRDWFVPIVADAEAGFGGPLNAFELMKAMIEAGAAGVHFEDQVASEKKCGHMGGKVLVATGSFVRTLVAARLAADVMGVATVLVARTDADSAKLIMSDVDPRDREFILKGERTAEGFFRLNGGLDCAIARALAYAPYADLLWCETSTPDLAEAKRFAEGVHARFPGKLLAYNCSPSFNWKKNLDDVDDRPLPARARGDGLQVPVRDPGRLPRPEPRHVRPGAGLPRPRHGRVHGAAAAGVRRRGPGLHRHEAPARGRHRLLRPRGPGGLRRDGVDARPHGVHRGGPVLSAPSQGG